MPNPTEPASESAAAAAVPSTVVAAGFSEARNASASILSGSLIARFTPEATTGLPANRSRPFTPTSVAKMTAAAPAITEGSRGGASARTLGFDVHLDAGAFTAAATSESAAM